MPRAFNIVLLAVMIAGAVVVYALKYQAEAAANTVTHLQADIVAEKVKIRTLTAEWATLNQPSRLEAEVKEHADYFQLQPFSPDQVAAITDIPVRPLGGAVPPVATAPATPAAAANDAAVKATLARIAAGGALRAR